MTRPGHSRGASTTDAHNSPQGPDPRSSDSAGGRRRRRGRGGRGRRDGARPAADPQLHPSASQRSRSGRSGAVRKGPQGGGTTRRSTPKGQLPEDAVYGLNAVDVALDSGMLKVLYVDEGSANERVQQVRAHATDEGLKVLPLARQGWSRALDPEQHQGVAGLLHPLHTWYIEDVVAAAGPDSCILVLDRVQDPQNLGAILRTAAATGVDGVVLPKAGGCPLTPAVHRASAGLSLLTRIVEDENLARVIDYLKDHGYWVLGCDSEAGEDATTFEFPRRRVLVMGNEAEGMRRLVRESCDYLVRIPMPGPKLVAGESESMRLPQVESLNVSVATAVMLYLAMADLARAEHEEAAVKQPRDA
jgi:23S rRNA (guanosine2251-2'-O)-methyltransferase